MGMQFGGAAGLLTYSQLQKSGFTILPYHGAKIHKYLAIGGAGFLAFNVGFQMVCGYFGDDNALMHLGRNKGGIMRGTTSWEKPVAE